MRDFLRQTPLPLMMPADGGGAGSVTAAKPSAAQLNAMARAIVLDKALDCFQQVAQITIAAPGTTNNVWNVSPRMVGLIKGFLLKITGTIANSDNANSASITKFGPANVVSQVTFSDLQNNTRIQTTGWHLNIVDTVKRRRVFGAANTTDTPIGYGSNFGPIACANTIAHNANIPFSMYYYIPLAYSDDDLRGAIYANIVNATMNLGITLNPAPGVIVPTDPVSAMFTLPTGSTGAVTLSNVTMTLYQSYLDQIPMTNKGPVLPTLDLSSIYELKQTALSPLTVAQDFPIPFANFRDFLSATLVFDNGGTFNNGTDINYLALQAANFVNISKMDPITAALRARNYIGDDMPSGVYYFDYRRKPISTVQYGNMELILNPSAVNAGAQVLMGFEDMALMNALTGAGSLAAG